MSQIEVDVWVRGTQHAATHVISAGPTAPDAWSETDVTGLLTEMLRALEREKNPGGEPLPVSLRGFSWIVTPYETGGVLIHLEMQMGTASAGPFQIAAERLTSLIQRAMQQAGTSPSVH
jgi:hypothetical protein